LLQILAKIRNFFPVLRKVFYDVQMRHDQGMNLKKRRPASLSVLSAHNCPQLEGCLRGQSAHNCPQL
jgi:hypothetical protein